MATEDAKKLLRSVGDKLAGKMRGAPRPDKLAGNQYAHLTEEECREIAEDSGYADDDALAAWTAKKIEREEAEYA